MLFFIWAAEDMYKGLHGIEDYGVFDCPDVEEANRTGLEMSEGVIESYGLEKEYYDYDYEEGEEIPLDYSEGTLWEIYKVKDEYVTMGIDRLNSICRRDSDGFIDEYTEEVDF